MSLPTDPAAGTPSTDRRQAFPDQLRALALLGIIVVNAPLMATSISDASLNPSSGSLDEAVNFAITFFAEGKFYLLFSFLFGYSANFIVKRTDVRSFRRWKRRLAGLAVIGLAHAIFFFSGDILFAYALLGFGLTFMFRRRDHTVLITAGVGALLGALWLGLLVLVAAADPGEIDADPALTTLEAALASGSFLGAAEARLDALPETLFVQGSLQWAMAFAAFCTGLVAGRHRYLADLPGRTGTWRRLALWGLMIGLPVQFAATWLQHGKSIDLGTGFESMAGVAAIIVTAPVLSAGYLGALALLSVNRPRVLTSIQDAGRASLTIYIGESIVLSTLFCGWGFGLFDELGAAAVAGVAILTWVVLVLALRLWLTRFRQGPLEALMGRWTRG